MHRYKLKLKSLGDCDTINPFLHLDPFHIMGMQPIWRTKRKTFSLLGIEIYSHVKIVLLCPPDWLHSHGRAKGLLSNIDNGVNRVNGVNGAQN